MHTTAPPDAKPAPNRLRPIVFWVATLVVAGELAAGSVWNLVPIEWIEAQLAHLGYPYYFAYVLGVAQVAAAVAIMTPRLPLVKEWAYAGMCFLWSGAVVSHLHLGDGPKNWAPPLMFGVLAVLSWALRPVDRRLPETRLRRETAARIPSWETRPRAWALPVAALVAMFAVSIATLPVAEAVTREWAVEYGWITD
jgi:hypothetical protein